MSSDVALRDKANGGLISISKAKELLATADIDTAIDLRDKASAFAAEVPIWNHGSRRTSTWFQRAV